LYNFLHDEVKWSCRSGHGHKECNNRGEGLAAGLLVGVTGHMHGVWKFEP